MTISGPQAPRLVAGIARSVLLIPAGLALFIAGIQNSVVWAVLVGSFVVMLWITIVVLSASLIRREHRLQLETGWLLTQGVTYPVPQRGTSVERTAGERRATIGRGAEAFAAKSEAVMRWEVKTRAGFRVIRVGRDGAFFSDAPVVGGECAVVRLGPLRETVAVVRVVTQPRLRGFAYGTLPEHPLRGEEAFLVEWRDDDAVDLVIRSFARPNGLGWTVLWPGIVIARRVFLRRYLRALLE